MHATWSILSIWKICSSAISGIIITSKIRHVTSIYGSTCVFTGRKRTVLFSWLASLSARRGENIHNAGLSVRVVWDAPNRVDEQTNQESAPFNSHPRHFLLTIRRYCFVVKSRLLVSHGQDTATYHIFFKHF